MHEVTIVSGRHNHLIDPYLTIWHWQIPVYLFLGGLVAGLLFFSALYHLRGKDEEFPTIVRLGALWAPILLSIGMFALFLDLDYKWHLFRFYTTLRLKSPMSWGAWTLLVILPLSFLWAALHVQAVFPRWKWPHPIFQQIVDYARKKSQLLAWVLMVLSMILGMYTGILLSAFNARPLWNTAILGPLFLVSGLSTGLAFLILLSRNHEEQLMLNKIDLMAISVELFFIIHLFMGLLASSEVKIQAAKLFLGGPFTAPFWVLVVGLGIVIPALLEILEISHWGKPTRVAAVLILVGGILLRFIFVQAGQISSF